MLSAFGRGISTELARARRCLLHCCQKCNKKLAHFAVIPKATMNFKLPRQLCSELSIDEQGGDEKPQRALTGGGAGKIS
jgi:hypothetical protein